MLEVTGPADDLGLLTIEQLRAAAGMVADDDSADEELSALGLRVAAEIATYCRIARGLGGQPTMRRESLLESIRIRREATCLALSRRFVAEVQSVVADDVELDVDSYEVEMESGLLFSLSGGVRTSWRSRTVVVAYDAGFDDVPDDLAGVASDMVRIRLSANSRDPLARSVSTEVPDVLTETVAYWVGAVPGSTTSGLPPDLAARLDPYRNLSV